MWYTCAYHCWDFTILPTVFRSQVFVYMPAWGCLYSVEWNGGMEWWNGTVEWNSGMEWWNSGMTTPIDRVLWRPIPSIFQSSRVKASQLYRKCLKKLGSVWSNREIRGVRLEITQKEGHLASSHPLKSSVNQVVLCTSIEYMHVLWDS